MAEGHQAVAFSFAVTHEGLDVNFDFEVSLLSIPDCCPFSPIELQFSHNSFRSSVLLLEVLSDHGERNLPAFRYLLSVHLFVLL